MTVIMSGKKVSYDLIKKMKVELDYLSNKNISPRLAIIRLGELPDSVAYEYGAKKKLNEIGLDTATYAFPKSITQEKFISEFCRINEADDIHGILLLKPLPNHIDVSEIMQIINPLKDVDGMSALNLGKMIARDQNCFPPCTPVAVIEILKFHEIDLVGKSVVIIGHSTVVGKPLNTLMLNENATVTVCHIHSKNIKDVCQKADIIISATGKAGLISKDFVKQGAIVVDVGISLDAKGKIRGDIEYEEVVKKASYITPVPGGVGALTTTILAKHVVESAKKLTLTSKRKELLISKS